MVYFLIAMILYFIVEYSQVSISPEDFLSAVLPYFICESIGIEAGREDCQELLDGVRIPYLYNASVARVIFTGYMTLVVFLFSTNFRKHYKTIGTKIRTSLAIY